MIDKGMMKKDNRLDSAIKLELVGAVPDPHITKGALVLLAARLPQQSALLAVVSIAAPEQPVFLLS